MALSVGTVINNTAGDHPAQTFNFSGTVPAGASVIVFSSYSVSNENSQPVSDNKNGTYTQFYGGGTPLPTQQLPFWGHGISSLSASMDIWGMLNISNALGTSDVLTMAARPDITPLGDSVETVAVKVVSDSGELLTLDQVAGTQVNFTDTGHISPTVTTTKANEILFGSHVTQTGTAPWWTPSSPWTELADRGSDADGAGQRLIAVQTQTVSSTGNYNSSGTASAQVYSLDAIVTFSYAPVVNITVSGVRAAVNVGARDGNIPDTRPSAAVLIVSSGNRW